jgi:hypothetical protein
MNDPATGAPRAMDYICVCPHQDPPGPYALLHFRPGVDSETAAQAVISTIIAHLLRTGPLALNSDNYFAHAKASYFAQTDIDKHYQEVSVENRVEFQKQYEAEPEHYFNATGYAKRDDSL